MQKYASILFLIILTYPFTMEISAQEYGIGSAKMIIKDPSRGNRKIRVDVFYPADQHGKNVPVSQSGEKFPVICFGHGFVMHVKYYNNFIKKLVPLGYIFVLPDTEKGIAPSHSDLAYDISYTLDHFRMLGSDQTSVFYGRIGKKNCAMGHSMGGGSSALAVSYNLNISALATFAMYNTNPSSSSAAKFIQVPALVFSGSNDCITPPEEHQIPFFENLATPEKHYIEITGGSHCQMAAYNKLCRFGEKTCRPVPEIDLSFQHKIIFDYLIPWLDYHLKNNTDSGDTFNSLITGDQRVKTLSYK